MKDESLIKQKILALLFRTELRPGEEIINNSDAQIAKELGLNKQFVCRIIGNYFRDKKREELTKIKNYDNSNTTSHNITQPL